jgi:ribosomal protein S18 acetylase RimI-like enzyme
VADPPVVTFRPIEPGDAPFLCRVYASTREEELRPVPWTPAEKAAFLRQQFQAQHAYYQEHYTGTRFEVILRDGQPVGRLYVARWPDEIRIVDIALLPEHRGAGIGTGILRDLLAEAVAAGKPVRIHVERRNPARHLYERLGFLPIEDKGVYHLMEWRPPGSE